VLARRGFSCSSWIVLAAVVALGSCRTAEPTDGSPSEMGGRSTGRPGRSEELARLQFDDIPVPDGFALRNRSNESYVFEAGQTRVGRLVYVGKSSQADVRAMYVERMPLEPYGWRFTSGSVDADDQALHFEKRGHRCVIGFHNDHGQLVVTVTVENVSQ
jgi:hypothetical protein